MARVAAGDRSAFAALVEAHRAAIWANVRLHTPDDAAAEDALQETFLAAWRGASGWSGEAPVRAWLRGIARAQAARTWRRRAGQPIAFSAFDDQLGPAAGWGSEDPELAASRAERDACLRRALATLPEEDRAVLTLRDQEGLTGPEAAEALGLSLDALKSRLHRARLHLMAALRAPGGCDVEA